MCAHKILNIIPNFHDSELFLLMKLFTLIKQLMSYIAEYIVAHMPCFCRSSHIFRCSRLQYTFVGIIIMCVHSVSVYIYLVQKSKFF